MPPSNSGCLSTTFKTSSPIFTGGIGGGGGNEPILAFSPIVSVSSSISTFIFSLFTIRSTLPKPTKLNTNVLPLSTLILYLPSLSVFVPDVSFFTTIFTPGIPTPSADITRPCTKILSVFTSEEVVATLAATSVTKSPNKGKASRYRPNTQRDERF